MALPHLLWMITSAMGRLPILGGTGVPTMAWGMMLPPRRPVDVRTSLVTCSRCYPLSKECRMVDWLSHPLQFLCCSLTAPTSQAS